MVRVGATFIRKDAKKTHVMLTAVDESAVLKNQVEKFWEAEQTGVNDVKAFNSKEFINKIKFDGKRYSVSLPWKQKDEECMSAQLPVNYTQSVSRLISLVRRLKERSGYSTGRLPAE